MSAPVNAALLQDLYSRAQALIDRQALPEPLRAWHLASFAKTLLAQRDGKLSPATLPLLLQHDDAERPVLEALCLACACFHTAADLIDDCEDDDLDPATWGEQGRAQAINVSSGLVFLIYQALIEMPIDAERRHSIQQEFTGGGWAMHVGQHADLAATNGIRAADHRDVSRLKSGGEVRTFFAAAALALGRDPAPYRQFGEAFGALIQTLSDVADVWLCETSSDLITGKQGLPIAAALAAGDPALRLALAGDRSREARQRHVRRLLCSPAILAAWRAEIAFQADRMHEALDRLGDEAGLQQLAVDIVGQARELADALEAAAPKLQRAERRDTRPLKVPATDQAIAFLQDDPQHAGSRELQRWGYFGKPEVIGDVFGPAIVGEAMALAGIDQGAVREHLERRQDADGWRFYPGHPEIPCDADDLGQVISFLLATGATAETVAGIARTALETARGACEGEGALSVWFYGGLSPAESVRWAGEQCLGSIGNGLRGIARLHLPEWQPILARTVDDLLAAGGPDGLWQGVFYPEPYLCTLLVVKGLLAQRPYLAGRRAEQVDARLRRVLATITANQRLDGGWGSAQRTAAALQTWLLLDPLAPGARYAVAYLEDAQLADGGWAAEGYYMAPGPESTLAPFCSRQLTTALCLGALQQASQPVAVPLMPAAPLMASKR